MDKIVTNERLKLQPTGTFILRFSDGTLGGITIAWVADDPNNPGIQNVFLTFFLLLTLKNRIEHIEPINL